MSILGLEILLSPKINDLEDKDGRPAVLKVF